MKKFIVILVLLILPAVALIVYTRTPQLEEGIALHTIDRDTMMHAFMEGTGRTPSAAFLSNQQELEEVAIGFGAIHGLGFRGDTLYVSSETDGVLYQVKDEETRSLATINFAHDIVFDADGSVVTPVFLEDTVVRVQPTGRVQVIAEGLDGPNGISWIPGRCFFVTNFFSGTVECIDTLGNTSQVVSGLLGPAGIVQKGADLYIANFMDEDRSIVRYHIDSLGISARPEVVVRGLVHAESLGVYNGVLYVTHVRDGSGVVSRVTDEGEVIDHVVTSLPDPLIGHFTADGFVYLASPTDPSGRVLRARL